MYTIKEYQQRKTKILELISDYNKVAGYKINMQKSITFLCTSNQKVKFETKSTIPLKLHHPKIKYLTINLKKYVCDL